VHAVHEAGAYREGDPLALGVLARGFPQARQRARVVMVQQSHRLRSGRHPRVVVNE